MVGFRYDGEIDWVGLRASAFVAMQQAYAPYSGFRVGAAALSTSGVVTGCNVENVSISRFICTH